MIHFTKDVYLKNVQKLNKILQTKTKIEHKIEDYLELYNLTSHYIV